MDEEKNKQNTPVEKEDGCVDELERCRKERDEYLEGWKRAKADFINYKKDEARRIEDALKFGNEAMVRELIGVLDSFHLAVMSHKDEAEAKGLLLIMGQLEELLKRFGLEKINVNPGDEFDPAIEEAIREVPSDKSTGAIHEEVSKGYRLHGRVIRPARVSVSKGQHND